MKKKVESCKGKSTTCDQKNKYFFDNFFVFREENRNYYRIQAEKNSYDLTSKNMELIEKIQELENLKTKYQDSLINVQRLEAKVRN